MIFFFFNKYINLFLISQFIKIVCFKDCCNIYILLLKISFVGGKSAVKGDSLIHNQRLMSDSSEINKTFTSLNLEMKEIKSAVIKIRKEEFNNLLKRVILIKEDSEIKINKD